MPDMLRYHSATESAQPMSGGGYALPVSNYESLGR
jgi:hypothetical protein